MSWVFVSYRRSDNRAMAERIGDYLLRRLGAGRVFLDASSIRSGDAFPQVIASALDTCEVLVAVIGRSWVGGMKGDDADWIRIEIERALERRIRIFPVFIDGAVMPPAAELPETIHDLCTFQGASVEYNPAFEFGMDRLVRELTRTLVARGVTDAGGVAPSHNVILTKERDRYAAWAAQEENAPKLIHADAIELAARWAILTRLSRQDDLDPETQMMIFDEGTAPGVERSVVRRVHELRLMAHRTGASSELVLGCFRQAARVWPGAEVVTPFMIANEIFRQVHDTSDFEEEEELRALELLRRVLHSYYRTIAKSASAIASDNVFKSAVYRYGTDHTNLAPVYADRVRATVAQWAGGDVRLESFALDLVWFLVTSVDAKLFPLDGYTGALHPSEFAEI